MDEERSSCPLEEIMAEYGPEVYKLAYRMTGQHHSAEDIYQETFYRIFRYWSRFDPKGNLGGWIYKTALHEIWKWQQEERKQGVTLEDTFWKRQLTPLSEETLQNFQVQALEEKLQKGLQTLSFTKRAVFVLRTFQGMAFEEIASLLKISVSNAKVLLHRARQELAQKLEERK